MRNRDDSVPILCANLWRVLAKTMTTESESRKEKENKSQYWPRGANKHVDTAEIEKA